MTVSRSNWENHIEDVVRSRHYTWLPEGLGGEPVDKAMSYLVTDIMHVCRRTGASWEQILADAAARFEHEESESVIANTLD
jgi:hypothetical protein